MYWHCFWFLITFCFWFWCTSFGFLKSYFLVLGSLFGFVHVFFRFGGVIDFGFEVLVVCFGATCFCIGIVDGF